MKYEEILNKFVEVNVYPSKYTIEEVINMSANTFRRNGFVMSELQKDYKTKTAIKNSCKLCGCEISKHRMFCSRLCACKHNAKPKNIKYCLNCNSELLNNDKYCSHDCRVEYTYKEYIYKWLSGEVVEYNTRVVPSPIRKYLFIKHDSKCSRCGWGEINPITGNTPLEVEHIDGDSTNNKEENLTLLCPNCHSLTPTYKALNKGNGRHSRRERYRDGKSY